MDLASYAGPCFVIYLFDYFNSYRALVFKYSALKLRMKINLEKRLGHMNL